MARLVRFKGKVLFLWVILPLLYVRVVLVRRFPSVAERI